MELGRQVLPLLGDGWGHGDRLLDVRILLRVKHVWREDRSRLHYLLRQAQHLRLLLAPGHESLLHLHVRFNQWRGTQIVDSWGR
jgi:hypothetical protein